MAKANHGSPSLGLTVDPNSAGYVYFLLARQERRLYVKIGRTEKCPYRRMRELRREDKYGTLHALEMLGSVRVNNMKAAEDSYHDQLRKHRAQFGSDRELFHLNEDVLEVIRYNVDFHFCHPHCHDKSAREIAVLQEVDRFRRIKQSELHEAVNAFERDLRERRKKKPVSATSSKEPARLPKQKRSAPADPAKASTKVASKKRTTPPASPSVKGKPAKKTRG